MTDTKSLTNEQVITGLKKCIRIEFENGAEMVAYIEEVDRRKLYFDFDRPSLFEFLTKEMGLPNATAQLRIDSARLMKVFPEIREDLESGKLHMSQLAFVAKAARQKKRESGKAVSVEEKRNLIEKIKQAPDARTAQKVVSQELDLKLKIEESVRAQKDESVCLEMQLTKEQMAVIERAKELLSHVNPDQSWAELFTNLAERLVRQKDPMIERRPVRKNNDPTSGPEVTALQDSRHIPARVRRAVFQRDKCCQWKKTEGGVCGSTFQLQPDHIQSVWAGGTNELSNFRLLCSSHNREKYRRESGVRPAP